MKKLLVCLVALLAYTSYGQEQLKTTGAQLSTPDSLKQIQKFNDSIDYQVSLIDAHINSINLKWDWIEARPEEKQIAVSEGWFQRMEVFKTELNAKRENLINLKK